MTPKSHPHNFSDIGEKNAWAAKLVAKLVPTLVPGFPLPMYKLCSPSKVQAVNKQKKRLHVRQNSP